MSGWDLSLMEGVLRWKEAGRQGTCVSACCSCVSAAAGLYDTEWQLLIVMTLAAVVLQV